VTGESDFWLKDQLGMELSSEDGRTTVVIECDDRHLNPHGSVHGSVVFAMVDTGMGAATLTTLSGDDFCASVEVHVRYLEPVFSGTLRADIRIVKAGRRIVQLEADVWGAGERRVATATGSFAVIEG
jgi:acyl-CoA thioesterase